jgi:hypothetical protein
MICQQLYQERAEQLELMETYESLLNAKGEKIKPGKIVKNNEPYKKIKNYTIVNGKVIIRFHMFFFVTPSFEK